MVDGTTFVTSAATKLETTPVIVLHILCRFVTGSSPAISNNFIGYGQCKMTSESDCGIFTQYARYSFWTYTPCKILWKSLQNFLYHFCNFLMFSDMKVYFGFLIDCEELKRSNWRLREVVQWRVASLPEAISLRARTWFSVIVWYQARSVRILSTRGKRSVNPTLYASLTTTSEAFTCTESDRMSLIKSYTKQSKKIIE